MPFCINCTNEYNEGITACSDCGSELIDELPFEDERCADEGDIPAFLCSLDDGMDSEIIVSLLRSEGIPVMKKRHEGGEFLNIYMGSSFYGVELYVPSKLHAKAKELLAAEPVVEQEDVDDELKQAEKSSKRGKLIKIWLILIFPPFGLIWLLLAWNYSGLF
jgi:hypothetical protein